MSDQFTHGSLSRVTTTATGPINTTNLPADEAVRSQYKAYAEPAPEPTVRPKMPASIAKAIVKVMQIAKGIEKDAENKHGGYKYASVDSVYEGVQKAMADAGLVVIPMEESVEKLDDKLIKFVFSFIVATETDTWEDPRNRRTVYMQWMGPQTFQGGQSYCEKAFLKGLFKLNTGEPEQEALPGGSTADPEAKKGKGTTKTKPVEMLDAADSATARDVILKFLKDVKTFGPTEQDDFSTKYGATIQRMTEKDAEDVRAAFKAKRG
jgi:hypothetical protein